MAGAEERHNRIAGNLFFHLRAAARGSPCGVYISDMKLRVTAVDAFYYPDVMLGCDNDDSDPLFKRLPCVVAEVSSPSTEVIDRREKLLAYRTLPSLRYYLLLAQDERRVELYQRGDNGRWTHTIYQQEGEFTLICPPDYQAHFSMDELYEDVRFDEASA